jgi:hypothetical protein
MSRVWRAAAWGWMAVILAGSVLPPSVGAPGGPAWHLIGYGVLGGILGLTFGPLSALGLGFGYGVVIEGIQGLLPYRKAELGDLIVNAVGLAAGLILVRALLPRTVRERQGV